MILQTPWIAAFAGEKLIARGALAEVVACCKAHLDANESRAERVALFDDESGRVVDVDFSGGPDEVMARLPVPEEASVLDDVPASDDEASARESRGPGRPRLGVVCREISLLRRHWDWLAEQPGSASATLRRLVETAKKDDAVVADRRRAIDAAHRFMWDMAGNQPHFEEATRSLFASDFDGLEKLISEWPCGIREQLARFIDRARG